MSGIRILSERSSVSASLALELVIDIRDDHASGAAWQSIASCSGQTDLFFAAPGERPEARARREAKARQLCLGCPVLQPCQTWARENREYGFWGGESEEDRAMAGYRVDMPVGRVARYPRGKARSLAFSR
jgi:WhiB family transcriptional regulator, redox-sensing transcriptional regulator